LRRCLVTLGLSQVVPVLISTMDGISTVRVYLPKDLRQAEHRQSVYKSIQVCPALNEQPGR